MKYIAFSICVAALAMILFPSGQARADEDLITVFVPSVAGIERLLSETPAGTKSRGEKSIWKNDDIPEADILMSLMEPQAYRAHGMDMPRSFAMIFYPDTDGGREQSPERYDLLGDVEEIRYLENKAWGANVALAKPGLYQFIMEGKPFWNERKNEYFQQSAKLSLPVLSDGAGWDMPVGQGLEIVPLTRPYGLRNPAFFSATLVNDGKGVEGAKVFAGRLNMNRKAAPGRWLRQMETRSGQGGVFSFVLNEAGWWYCEAIIKGEPLKGMDGQMKNVRQSAILWLYVDGGS